MAGSCTKMQGPRHLSGWHRFCLLERESQEHIYWWGRYNENQCQVWRCQHRWEIWHVQSQSQSQNHLERYWAGRLETETVEKKNRKNIQVNYRSWTFLILRFIALLGRGHNHLISNQWFRTSNLSLYINRSVERVRNGEKHGYRNRCTLLRM